MFVDAECALSKLEVFVMTWIDISKLGHYPYSLILYSREDFVMSRCLIYHKPVICLVGAYEAISPSTTHPPPPTPTHTLW